MKTALTFPLTPLLWLATCLLTNAETSEHVSKRFPAQAGGKVAVDVDFGSIEVTAHPANEITVDVIRRVTRSTKADEESYLAERPIEFSEEGNRLMVHSRAKSRSGGFTGGKQKAEARYKINVPAQFNAELKTSGGAIAVSDLTGEVAATSAGGELQFARLRGSLEGRTSGGPIRVTSCDGVQIIKTSGGRIEVESGSGSVEGATSGGPIAVKDFRGPITVKTSGGGITLENVAGKIQGKTSGGPIAARLAAPLTNEVELATSGGSVIVRVPEDAAFELDASTSGGSVRSDLVVDTAGKPPRGQLKGPVNGGGKPIVLRTSGGSIQVRKVSNPQATRPPPSSGKS